MESIGILYELKKSDIADPLGNVTADLHINYLKTQSNNYLLCKKYNRSLDIGIMLLDRVADIKSISIYFPFKLYENDVEDLGEVIREHNLFCTLFNGDYVISNIPNSPLYYKVEPITANQDAFLLCVLEKNTLRIDRSLQIGTLLTISIADIPTGMLLRKNGFPGLYFRLRIKNLSKDMFFYEDNISNDIFQSAFSKSELVDFRINEMREFDRTIIDDLKKDRYFVSFRKFHFFFIGSSENEEVQGNVNYVDTRLLDPQRWADYEESIRKAKVRYIAYHWCKKADESQVLQQCSVFLRTKYRSMNALKVVVYCIVVILLGFVGSLLSTAFIDLLW